MKRIDKTNDVINRCDWLGKIRCILRNLQIIFHGKFDYHFVQIFVYHAIDQMQIVFRPYRETVITHPASKIAPYCSS